MKKNVNLDFMSFLRILFLLTFGLFMSCSSSIDEIENFESKWAKVVESKVLLYDAKNQTSLNDNTVVLGETSNHYSYKVEVLNYDSNGHQVTIGDWEICVENSANWMKVKIDTLTDFNHSVAVLNIDVEENKEQPRSSNIIIKIKHKHTDYFTEYLKVEQTAAMRTLKVYPMDFMFKTDEQVARYASNPRYGRRCYNSTWWNTTLYFIDLEDGKNRAYCYNPTENTYTKENYMDLSDGRIYWNTFVEQMHINMSNFSIPNYWSGTLDGYLVFSSWGENLEYTSIKLYSTNLCTCFLKLYTTDYKNTFVQYLYDGGEYNCVKWNKETAYDVRVYMPKQYPGSNLDIYCSHYKSGGDSTGGGTGNGGNPGSGNPGGGNKDETSGFDIVKVSVYGVTVAKNGGKPSGNYYHYYKWIAKTTGKIFLCNSSTSSSGPHLLGVASRNSSSYCGNLKLPKLYTYKVTNYGSVGVTKYYYFDS